ncbi:MAG: DUF2007 domain-containing protein [Thermoguttaceae bacterium]|jgi:hypothetical protein|nr:DUF2007 domain-containing protein [Thermoguttaceae bacterium]
MPNRPVAIAWFLNSAEAGIFRGILDADGIRAELFGEAMAGWFWHWVPAIRGVRLVVSEQDADRALTVLRSQAPIDEASASGLGETSGGAEGEARDRETPDELTRAWRASVIGLLFLPPLLTVYSTWLLVHHGFVIGRSRNWRTVATWLLNASVLMLMLVLLAALIYPSPEPSFPQRSEPRPIEKRVLFPLVPSHTAETETGATD